MAILGKKKDHSPKWGVVLYYPLKEEGMNDIDITITTLVNPLGLRISLSLRKDKKGNL